MKRLPIGIMVFLMMLWFSGNSVHAKTPNRLQVNSAEIGANIEDIEIEGNYTSYFSIDGINFGDEPRVSLGNFLLIVDSKNNLNTNNHIEATLQEYIPPGTYRLSVARSGFDFSHPEKADSLDVTISEATSDPKSGDPGENSGALERGTIYEIQKTSYITLEGNADIKCSCRDENDIALNGGYEITHQLFVSDLELTTLKDNMYYSQVENDSYQLSFYNPITLIHGEYIKIDAYLRCMEIPNE